MAEDRTAQIVLSILEGLSKGALTAVEAQRKLEQQAAEMELQRESLAVKEGELYVHKKTLNLQEAEAKPLDYSDPTLQGFGKEMKLSFPQQGSSPYRQKDLPNLAKK